MKLPDVHVHARAPHRLAAGLGALPLLALLAPALLGAAGPSSGEDAADWRHWRGPRFDGSSTATGLPERFSADENVVWRSDLPGPGASTPIVVGSRVFLTAVDEEDGMLLAVCYDRETGAELWIEDLSSGYRPGGKGSATSIHQRSNYASPSPVSDGERVVFFFGNGDLVATDLGGETLWARNLQQDFGDFAFQWTFSASPTLFEGLVVLPILQRDEPVGEVGKKGGESFLLGLDAKTGETRYRAVRPSRAVKESLESYATAIPTEAGGRPEILVVGGDVITGHDPMTGAERWRWGTWNEGHREAWWRVVPSPVVGGGVALACGPKGAPVCAVRLGGEGTLKDDHVAWKSPGRRDPVTTDVPTPLFYDGDFFVLSDLRQALTRVDAETGEQVWSIGLPGKERWRASPTGAAGRIWLVDHGGQVVVVDAADGEILHRANLGDGDEDRVRASIVACGSSLYVRTSTALFRIGS